MAFFHFCCILVCGAVCGAEVPCVGDDQHCEVTDSLEGDVNSLLQVPDVKGQHTASVLTSEKGDSDESLGPTATHQSQLAVAASALSDIFLGRTPKSEVEIVLAQYNEDIRWSDPYKHIRTVYCKGAITKSTGCQPLKNVGREGHTYLTHIVQNYDKLAKWTVFTQAEAPTNGYTGALHTGGHGLPGVTFDSYVLPESAGGLPREDGSAFIMTAAVHMPTLNYSIRRSSFDANSAPTLHQQSRCPQVVLLDGWKPWWDLDFFKATMGKKCKVRPESLHLEFEAYWQEHVQLPHPPDNIMFFTQGARFAASRERIRQRPKAFYELLLRKLTKKDDCYSYFDEWIWYYVIGTPTAAPCDSRLVIDEASKSDDFLNDDALFAAAQAADFVDLNKRLNLSTDLGDSILTETTRH